MADGSETCIAGGAGRVKQVRTVRHDGWTAKKIKLFLDHFAGTCNVTASCAAAGMGVSSLYRMRARDAAFAAAFEDALIGGYTRLEAMVLDTALNGQEVERENEEGEVEVVREKVDPKFALRVLAMHQRKVAAIRAERAAAERARELEAESEEGVRERILARLDEMAARRGEVVT
ncbi:hypothetical protein [Sphingomonas sp. ID0503]|uniref:hypothetical protein n=1 Tax=Sphingomonas sp. ID0503 TaxID=3399691 RepID=UPI003AFA7C4D